MYVANYCKTDGFCINFKINVHNQFSFTFEIYFLKDLLSNLSENLMFKKFSLYRNTSYMFVFHEDLVLLGQTAIFTPILVVGKNDLAMQD